MAILMSREDKLINLLTIKWNGHSDDVIEIHTICEKSFVDRKLSTKHYKLSILSTEILRMLELFEGTWNIYSQILSYYVISG